jgi:hypothetical protein
MEVTKWLKPSISVSRNTARLPSIVATEQSARGDAHGTAKIHLAECPPNRQGCLDGPERVFLVSKWRHSKSERDGHTLVVH